LDELYPLLPAEEELLYSCRLGNLYELPQAFAAEWTEFDAWSVQGEPFELFDRAAQQILGATVDDPVNIEELPAIALKLLDWELRAALEQLGRDEQWRPQSSQDWDSVRWARICCRREMRRWRSVDVENQSTWIRAEFLRLLLIQSQPNIPTISTLSIANAHILGTLRLSGTRIDIPFSLFNCIVSGGVELFDAHLKTINLGGSFIDYLSGDRADISGRLFLRNGFRCNGAVKLSGATISGGVEFWDSTVAPRHRIMADEDADASINLNSAVVERDVLFGDRFFCASAIDLDGINVHGDFSIHNSVIVPGTRTAVALTDATVSGSVTIADSNQLDGAFNLSGSKITRGVRFDGIFETAKGACIVAECVEVGGDFAIRNTCLCIGGVSIDTATIGGDVHLGGAYFANERQPVLVVTNSEIKRKLILGSYSYSDEKDPYVFSGFVDCELSTASALEFHSSWLQSGAVFDLNNFKYDTISCFDVDDIDISGARLLRSQYRRPYFNPQPFEHLAGVMRRTGREDEARSFIRLKNKEQRRWAIRRNWQELKAHLTERPDVWKLLGALNWMAYPAVALLAPVTAVLKYFFILLRALIFEKFLGSGFSRTPVVATFFLLLFLCGWVYEKAGEQGAIVPVNQMVLLDEDARRLCAGPRQGAGLQDRINWTNCNAVVAGFNEFRPYWYSLDLMLQFGPLGQRRDWQPSQEPVQLPIPLTGEYELSATALHTLVWMQSVLALGLYLLLAAMLTGIIKKE
jgi:hypothetical protein